MGQIDDLRVLVERYNVPIDTPLNENGILVPIMKAIFNEQWKVVEYLKEKYVENPERYSLESDLSLISSNAISDLVKKDKVAALRFLSTCNLQNFAVRQGDFETFPIYHALNKPEIFGLILEQYKKENAINDLARYAVPLMKAAMRAGNPEIINQLKSLGGEFAKASDSAEIKIEQPKEQKTEESKTEVGEGPIEVSPDSLKAAIKGDNHRLLEVFQNLNPVGFYRSLQTLVDVFRGSSNRYSVVSSYLIHLAIAEKSKKCIGFLLTHYPELANLCQKNGTTAVCSAISSGDKELARWFIAKADWDNMPSKDKTDAINAAIKLADLEIFETILAKDVNLPFPVISKDRIEKLPALHKIMEIYDARAKINQRSAEFYPPIINAILQGDKARQELEEKYKNAGINPEEFVRITILKNNQNDRLARVAIKSGSLEAVKYLAGMGVNFANAAMSGYEITISLSLLVFAVVENQVAIVKFILGEYRSKKKDVNDACENFLKDAAKGSKEMLGALEVINADKIADRKLAEEKRTAEEKRAAEKLAAEEKRAAEKLAAEKLAAEKLAAEGLDGEIKRQPAQQPAQRSATYTYFNVFFQTRLLLCAKDDEIVEVRTLPPQSFALMQPDNLQAKGGAALIASSTALTLPKTNTEPELLSESLSNKRMTELLRANGRLFVGTKNASAETQLRIEITQMEKMVTTTPDSSLRLSS